MTRFVTICLLIALTIAGHAAARPQNQSTYSAKFFQQLQEIFGKFSDSDLQKTFQTAQTLDCSNLVNGDGEWRAVAFLNENHSLGDWVRHSIDEVKADRAIYKFTSPCRSPRDPINVETRFPIRQSLDAYNQGTIDEIAVKANPPVRATFDTKLQAYSFELPYLHLVGQQNSQNVYSMNPASASDKYVADVVNHWDCKSVRDSDRTYLFLVCRTVIQPKSAPQRNARGAAVFGGSAYFVLSDGKEASATFELKFETESQ